MSTPVEHVPEFRLSVHLGIAEFPDSKLGQSAILARRRYLKSTVWGRGPSRLLGIFEAEFCRQIALAGPEGV